MFCLTNPTEEATRHYLANLADAPLSYPEIGMTQPSVVGSSGNLMVARPRGYHADHYRQRLGAAGDDAAFARAKNAVERWAMFRGFSWLRLVQLTPGAPPSVGAIVAVIPRHLGFWSINPCRVVYTVKEPDRFGFAYGTLRGHAEHGEERFLVERRPAATGEGEGTIWYDLFALSRPGPLAGLAAPLARRFQKRFARDSQAAMVSASR